MNQAKLLKAVRKNCINCMGTGRNKGYQTLIRNCTTRKCHLWPYRFGMAPEKAAARGRDVTP